MNKQDTFLGISSIDEVERFKPSIPSIEEFHLAKALSETPQDKRWHQEGDVWTHTQMVMAELVKLPEFQEMDSISQFITFSAAQFHDIGKIPTTKTEPDGSITSKGHSVAGMKMTREYINDHVSWMPWRVREAIAWLVRYHMMPGHFLDRGDPLYSITSASTVLGTDANLYMLHVLSKADTLGRIAEGTDKALLSVDLMKSFAEENKCLMAPFDFISNRHRMRYFFDRKGHPDIFWNEPASGQVVMMVGLPGAGKDYICKTKYPMHPVVGMDIVREDMNVVHGESEGQVSQETKERIRQQMRDKMDFVFNATNLVRDLRSKWIRLFRDYKYDVKIHYVEPKLKTILSQNSKRDRVVPERIIVEKFKTMDVPTELECNEMVVTTW